LDVERDDGVEHRIHVGLSAGRKIVRLDDVASKRLEVTRVSSAVLLEPSDVDLVHQGPSLRRHWMDDLLLRLSPRQASVARAYARVLEQRNAALRAGATYDLVDAFGDRLADLGEEITVLRERMISRASDLAATAYRDVAGSLARLDLRYRRAGGDRSMHDALAATADEERARGVTVVGPHRDDLDLTLDGHPARTFASRGEARTVALALRTVEVRLLDDKHGEPPILLVDDVAAELDARRRGFLVDLTRSGRQAIVSGTEAPAGADVVFDVHAGEVTLRA
jgi:DNA replication and repair protein RecF